MGDRDNLKAGLFVFGGIVLTLVVIVTLSDFKNLFEGKQQVRVYYHLSDGFHGLKEGSSVTLGHLPIGEVESIELHVDEQSHRVRGGEVVVKIPNRYKFYLNAVIELVVPPLGSGTRLNIRDLGDTGEYNPRGDPIRGILAGSELTSNLVRDMGIEDLQRHQLKAVIANIELITSNLSKDLPQITGSVRQVLEDLKPMARDARLAVADAKLLVVNVRERSDVWMDRVDSIIESADSSLVHVDRLLADKEPDLRVTIENVRHITQQVKDEMLDQMADALDGANKGLDNVNAATAEIKSFVLAQRPVLERTIANLQLTGAQLKLAAIEVRRSPWRLLYKPTDKELESDNLYDAARSFALAAGALDATAQSLQSVVEYQPNDQEQIDRILAYLESLFKRFESAEQSFWDALNKHTPAP